jgi:hypothetical protein
MPSRKLPLRPTASAYARLAAFAGAVGVLFALGGALLPASAYAEDLALGRAATASSTEDGRTDLRPALANDGNSSTRWSSAYSVPQWWRVDLGSIRTINRVELNWEVAYSSGYRIQTRTTTGPGGWTTAATITNPSAGWKSHTFAARDARQLRIYADAKGTPWGVSLWDARVCNQGSCSDAPPPPPADTDGDGVPDSSDQCDNQPGPASNNGCPSNPPPPPPPGGQVNLTPVDGGSGYYGQFSNPLPTDPSWFPIGVWGSYNFTPQNVQLDKDAGLNTYVWDAGQASWEQQNVAAAGMRSIRNHSDRSMLGPHVAGWLLGDEIDMCCGPPGFVGGNGYNMLTSTLASLPQDGRARYANYGKGVAFWQTDAQAQRFINEFQQLVSADIYWFTDPNERSRTGYRLAASYGWTVDRLRALDAMDRRPWEDSNGRKPIWNFVETGWPFTESAALGGRAITGPELRAAVWHSLIAGARGIIYFQHSFGGPHIGDHHTIRSNSEGTRPAVSAVNAQVKSLAPVLNAPSVGGLVSSSPGLRTLAKWQGGKFWVFAGRTANGGQTSNTINVPCVGNATAVVDGEGRSVPVSGGHFTDSFADGNAVHIYRIDGGSTCGAPAG